MCGNLDMSALKLEFLHLCKSWSALDETETTRSVDVSICST